MTHYKVLQRFGAFTYIEARLETGRTHQIRVHMAHINHPLLGMPCTGRRKRRWARIPGAAREASGFSSSEDGRVHGV